MWRGTVSPRQQQFSLVAWFVSDDRGDAVAVGVELHGTIILDSCLSIF